MLFPSIFLGLLLALAFAGFRVLKEYERGVVFRLGRFNGVRTAGLKWIIPGVDRMVRVSLREIVMDVPAQEVITRDNVSVKVNAVLYFRVLHPEKAVIQVENYLYGTSQLAQTTLRSVCGQAELDELLADRDRINQQLQEIIDLQTEPWGVKVRAVEVKQIDLPTEMQRAMAKQAEAERDRINQRLQEIIDLHTEPWGVKVRAVEVKQIDLPQEMQRAMAKQAEAEREKRAKIIHADGEFQASQRLADAAAVIQSQPAALQLRYLQTLSEISTENSSTTIFPIPIDILRPFYERAASDGESDG